MFVPSGTKWRSYASTQKFSQKRCVQWWLQKIGPPLSNSDHNTIQLIPTFEPALKCKQTVSVGQVGNKEELSGCFLTTDWNVFYGDSNINNTAEGITGYIHFCVHTVVAKTSVKIYPNNKD